MLIAAPSDAARPTRRAPCEPTRKAAAKIGASVEMVPSIRPMRDGWTKHRIWLRSPCLRHRVSRLLRIASADVARDTGIPIVVSIALRMPRGLRAAGPPTSTTWLIFRLATRLISVLQLLPASIGASRVTRLEIPFLRRVVSACISLLLNPHSVVEPRLESAGASRHAGRHIQSVLFNTSALQANDWIGAS